MNTDLPLRPVLGLSRLQEETWYACSTVAYIYTGTVLMATATLLEALLGRGTTALGQVSLTQGPGYLGLSVWF